jgi:hypothetical protein
MYCVYCTGEFTGVCVLLEDRLRDTNVCVLSVFICLLLNVRYLSPASYGADIDEVMKLKLTHVLWNVWVATELGAPITALDAVFEWVPSALPAPATDQCVGLDFPLDLKCLYLTETQSEVAKIRVKLPRYGCCGSRCLRWLRCSR